MKQPFPRLMNGHRILGFACLAAGIVGGWLIVGASGESTLAAERSEAKPAPAKATDTKAAKAEDAKPEATKDATFELDDVVPSEFAEEFQRRHPQADVHLLPSGHELTDQLEGMWGRMQSFLHLNRESSC